MYYVVGNRSANFFNKYIMNLYIQLHNNNNHIIIYEYIKRSTLHYRYP